MFGTLVRASWITAFVITLGSELTPRPNLPPTPFYSYLGCKIILFLLLGFLTPLTFWRFNSLNYGTLFAIAATAAVEILQLWIPGHSFSVFELAGKLVLIIFGLTLALDARYDGYIHLGPLSVRLCDPYCHPEKL